MGLTLAFIAQRAEAAEIAHVLFVQNEANGFVFAALAPSHQIPSIWQGQRQASTRIITSGETGRRTKKHAENGTSPTIWLQDDRWPSTHEVADVLWNWPGVINVLALSALAGDLGDDSVDDLPVNAALLGRDGSEQLTVLCFGYPRDPKVRAAVLERAEGWCEREVGGIHRSYSGFLDVHHILGVSVRDSAWTCVALCPNCHREAHFALALLYNNVMDSLGESIVIDGLDAQTDAREVPHDQLARLQCRAAAARLSGCVA